MQTNELKDRHKQHLQTFTVTRRATVLPHISALYVHTYITVTPHPAPLATQHLIWTPFLCTPEPDAYCSIK